KAMLEIVDGESISYSPPPICMAWTTRTGGRGCVELRLWHRSPQRPGKFVAMILRDDLIS
ncbi:MAG: hypothetical protein ACPH09_12530, partial [Pseudomonadales bacterium]